MQGLKENKTQFLLLVLVNAFVGAMVGMERSILPEFGKTVFSLSAASALTSFIVAFGISKAISNYAVGILSRKFTRKQILVTGWLLASPVPFILMYANHWNWIIVANIFLGITQGLTWSTTVVMKIDLVGSKNRGLAMGINEFAGYLSVGLAAYLSAQIASQFGYAFYPFIPGLFFVLAGLVISLFWVNDTASFIQKETAQSSIPLLKNIWASTSWKHRNLGSVTLNGLVNNLNDGVMWGLVPLLLVQRSFSIAEVGIVAGLYPIVWGISQLFTGKMGDLFCKKQLITFGMLLQALAIVLLVLFSSFAGAIIAAVLLGLGTGLVYPNFLTVVAENAHPTQRAEIMGVFRFWRDGGYVIGALLSGFLADWMGLNWALYAVAAVTAGAGLVANIRMCCTLKLFWRSQECMPAV
ncbi:MAG TPA: MFS transporter [Sediminibacterium sp.]|uniref:MFS transporter n=1 Tax=Sediminibacterium sp. TaxID=1917865 RepID=UPI0008D5B3F6|nr:MFS transporter [Sediminibacterium sp.]MBT9484800.1 MFS transporter [Sediminibacterium sp.]OHC85038.1 MAG: MFS transporter [Sphingobacteriia bacterium RIFOXYC2_FULL_35_18]OHC87088.1 MAG: MFS transporter [Sphingobacteriia bacterium RIFOXYD2_FULL_35_12]HLD52293.1 MFS transporter [Sediminibacterium sp.]